MEDRDKAERLAAALRDNLRRRKVQARALAEKPERDGDAKRNGDENTD